MEKLTDEQKDIIFRKLSDLNLPEFSDFLAEIIESGDYALAISFITQVIDKVEFRTRDTMLRLNNAQLRALNGRFN